MQEYLKSCRTWGATHAGVLKAHPVAYFSAEFGIHESLPIYSGGLGVLAGDHIKSASDLGVPLVGVGLFYAQGYFRQRLDATGWQHEDYLDVDVKQLPLELLIGQDNQPVTVAVETRGAPIAARVWKATVGPEHAAAARLRRRAEHARGPAADGAALRRRLARPHPPGAAPGRRRRPGPEGAGHPPGRPPSQRRAQRLRRAGDDPGADGDRGARVRGGDAPGLDHDVSSPRTRRCRPATTGSPPA